MSDIDPRDFDYRPPAPDTPADVRMFLLSAREAWRQWYRARRLARSSRIPETSDGRLDTFQGGFSVLAPGATVTLGIHYDDGSRYETAIEISADPGAPK